MARVLPLLTPAHLDRDFDYLVPPEWDEIARPGVRVRVRFAGRLVDGYLLSRHTETDHPGKLVRLERVVSAEQVLTPEILRLATTVAARCAGTRADVLRLAIPPRHARVENGGAGKKESGGAVRAVPPRSGGRSEVAGAATGETGAGRCPTSNETVPAPDSGSPPAGGDHVPAGIAPPRAADGRESEDAARMSIDDHVPSGREPESAGVEQAPVDDRRVSEGAEQALDGGDRVRAGAAGVVATDADRPQTADCRESSGDRASEHGRLRAGGTPSDSRVGPSEQRDSRVTHNSSGAADAGSGDPRYAAASAVTPGSADPGNPQEVGGAVGGPSIADTGVGAGTVPAGVDLAAWRRYRHGESFLTALAGRKGPRAAWQALPGENWARRLAELAAVVVAGGRSAVLMVPDQRDLDRVLRECEALVGESAVGLSAGLGPAARYRRWLAVLRGTARVVIGTRSAVFAPAADLGLIAIWDDGDDTYAEPRSPYPHAREVAMLRAHETGAAFVAAGFARTAEVQAVVESGWAHDLLADRATVRAASPRIGAPGDSDAALDRDPIARAVRIPGAAFAAARQALAAGEGVLVQVPRRGYVPALACTKCRTPARCRQCVGPLSLPEGGPADPAAQVAHSPVCRWCGRTEAAFRCPGCGGRVLRAVVIGAARTAEELGRAFPGVPIRGSSGAAMLDTVEPGPQVVVATVGAEPLLPGGYGVGLLLDGWALLGRADLRAAEDTLRRWLGAAALVKPAGRVLVMADPGVPTVQALLRWDPAGHAAAELGQRTEVGFPPAVRMAAIDGTPDAVAELLAVTELPAAAEVLGPVPLPATARKPSGSRADDDRGGPVEVERVLLRVPRPQGGALARALVAAQAVRSSQRAETSARVQIDPLDIG
ncbi:primosomal protein N' [Nocardia carnea]|uniref:primosomal protein N' family DNA-binding protein n=1 Tax=Nocardia carnea TaxID=37328 RepID=UPI0024551B7A|nr:primosomal protein N' [Nocardia carnea]